MPLIKGKSQKSFVKNLKTEMHAGKPMKQSLAIAYAMKKKAQKHKDGGEVKDDAEHMMSKLSPKQVEVAKRKLGHIKEEKGVHAQGEVAGEKMESGTSLMGNAARAKHSWAKQDSRRNLKELKSMPNPKLKGLAEGGEVHLDPAKTKSFEQGFKGQDPQPPPPEDDGSEGIVDRIMKRFSKGGQVANDTPPMADEEPNEFDDLVLDDDLEFHDDAANSGDELGDEQESEDRKDIVSRIMSSRKKKDRNPRPA